MITFTKIAAVTVAIMLFALAAQKANGDFMGKWEIVMTLPRLHKAEALWFKENIGLVFGHYRSLDDLLNKDIAKGMEKRQAFILRTSDNGRKWNKVYSGEGEVSRVSSQKSGPILYALGRRYDSNLAWRAFMLASKNLGESWSVLNVPNGGIIGIDFTNKNVGYAWSDDTVFRTDDGARTWFKIKYPLRITLNGPQPVVDANANLWAVSESRLVRINPNGDKFEINLPSSFGADLLDVATDNTLWFVGRYDQKSDKRASVFKITGGECEKIADLAYFVPRAFYVGQIGIFIIGSDTTDVPPRKILLYSKDMCKSWEQEEPVISDAMGPVFFEDEKAIWTYGSADRIQRRTLPNGKK